MNRSELLQLYPFLEDEEIVRIARNLHQAKASGAWRRDHNFVVLCVAPDDRRVKTIEFETKRKRERWKVA